MSYEYDPAAVSQMSDLLSGLNDIEDGKVSSTGTGSYDVASSVGAMTNILTSLNELNESEMKYGEPIEYIDNVVENVAATYVIGEDGLPIESYTAPTPVHKPVNSSYNPRPTTNWSLVEDKLPGTKNTKIYSIKCNHSSQVIMNGIMMYEAALTLVNLLNAGRMLSDAKVLGIISSGLQYTNVMTETLKAAKKRQTVLNESKYDEAKDLDIIIAEKKAEAYKLKERVMNFLKAEGYIQ